MEAFMKASKPGPKPSGKAKSAAQRMREYRARKAEEAPAPSIPTRSASGRSAVRRAPNSNA